MKNKFLFLILFVTFLFTSQYPKVIKIPKKDYNKKLVVKTDTIYVKKEIKKKNVYLNDNVKFLKRLAFLESRGNFKISRGRYLGGYQLHTMAIEQVGHKVNPDSFRLNPDIFNKEKQDIVVKKLLKYHRRLLWKEIKNYDGKILEIKITDKTTKKIKVTKSGILAAAHLGGAGSVINLLSSNGQINFRDGNGTPISYYLEKFSDLRVDF